ncbi:hypothetical protein, partial [Bathymodiolus thermophilus thioautotrophic gill symbiont]
MGDSIESNITLHVDSGRHKGTTVFSYKDTPDHEVLLHAPQYSIKFSDVNKSHMVDFTYDNDIQHPLLSVPTKIDPYVLLNMQIHDEDYTKEEALLQIKKAEGAIGDSSIDN